MIIRIDGELLATKYEDISPGEPYYPAMYGTDLFRRHDGTYCIASSSSPASITTVSSEWAMEFISSIELNNKESV